MVFSGSSWQDCLDTGRSTGIYIVFYQGGPIDNISHMFQFQLLNLVLRLNIIQHVMQ